MVHEPLKPWVMRRVGPVRATVDSISHGREDGSWPVKLWTLTPASTVSLVVTPAAIL